MHMCIIMEPASGVWCPQAASSAGGDEKGDLGVPPSVSPAAHLFFPVAEECPPVPGGIVPPQEQEAGGQE